MIETDAHAHLPRQEDKPNIWMRAFIMIAMAIFFAIAETLLFALAVVQFFWVVIAKEKNVAIADFGRSLSVWISQVVQFQTFATEERPFPWAEWPKEPSDRV